jgi:hypothetical protein
MSGTHAAICINGDINFYEAKDRTTPEIYDLHNVLDMQCSRIGNQLTLSFSRLFYDPFSNVEDLSKSFYLIAALRNTGSGFFLHSHRIGYNLPNGLNLNTPTPTLSPTANNESISTNSPTLMPTLAISNPKNISINMGKNILNMRWDQILLILLSFLRLSVDHLFGVPLE